MKKKKEEALQIEKDDTELNVDNHLENNDKVKSEEIRYKNADDIYD